MRTDTRTEVLMSARSWRRDTVNATICLSSAIAWLRLRRWRERPPPTSMRNSILKEIRLNTSCQIRSANRNIGIKEPRTARLLSLFRRERKGDRASARSPFFGYSRLSARLRNRREIHHRPASATTEKIILLRTLPAPPKSHPTMSNRKRPMLPQLIAPMMTRMSAILSSIGVFLSP